MIKFKNIYFNSLLVSTYNKNVKRYGYTPQGLFWNSKKSQYHRFEIIYSLLKTKLPNYNDIEIADIGCGYASFLNFLNHKKVKFNYSGYDINENLINYCKKKYPSNYFECSYFPRKISDVTIISGTYNYAVTNNLKSWEDYVFFNLRKCVLNSRLALIFNLQYTNKKSFIRNHIYFACFDDIYKKLKNEFKSVDFFYSSKSSTDIYFIILK